MTARRPPFGKPLREAHPGSREKSVSRRNDDQGLGSAGTGRGLYLVDTLVDRYGEGLRIEDNEPKGAVFVVELPRDK